MAGTQGHGHHRENERPRQRHSGWLAALLSCAELTKQPDEQLIRTIDLLEAGLAEVAMQWTCAFRGS